MMRNPVKTSHLMSLFIICGCLSFSINSTYATVADGVHAYEKGNYQQAREAWLPYAALGNPNALYNLGQLSRMGRGVEKDYTKARDYYQRAAEQGHVGAQRNLGTLYYFGRIGEVDPAKALDWLTKAAINGDARSQLMVGTMYYNGIAGEKNNIQAYAWIMLASQNGLRSATNALEKLDNSFTIEQIKQAKELAPNMISRQLSPDDIGLMVHQQDENTPDAPELNTPKPEETLPEETLPEKPEQVVQDTPKTEPDPLTSESGLDNFRVQLGSFSSEEAAQKALKTLKNRLSYLTDTTRGNIEFADLGAKGIFYRLQLSPFKTRTDAEDLCAQLKENGQSCYVVTSP